MAYIHVTLAAKQYWKHTLAFHCCRLVSAALKQSLQRQMLAAIFWVFPLHHSSKDMTDLPSVNCGKLCASCLQYCVIWCFVRRFTTLSNPPHAAGGPLHSICLKVRSNFELRSDADTQSTISRRRRGRHDVESWQARTWHMLKARLILSAALNELLYENWAILVEM